MNRRHFSYGTPGSINCKSPAQVEPLDSGFHGLEGRKRDEWVQKGQLAKRSVELERMIANNRNWVNALFIVTPALAIIGVAVWMWIA